MVGIHSSFVVFDIVADGLIVCFSPLSGLDLFFFVIDNNVSLGARFGGNFGGSLHGFSSMAGVDSYPAVVPCLICMFTKQTVPQNGQKNVPVAMALLHFLLVHKG